MRIADIGWVGWIHTTLTLAALGIAGVMLAARKGTPRHRHNGLAFVATLATGSALSLTIYRRGFFYFPHAFALLALLALALGWSSAHFKRPTQLWREVHLSAMLLATWDIVGGLINETFLRVNGLHGPASNDAKGAAHMIAMMAFSATIIWFVVSIRRGARLRMDN